MNSKPLFTTSKNLTSIKKWDLERDGAMGLLSPQMRCYDNRVTIIPVTGHCVHHYFMTLLQDCTSAGPKFSSLCKLLLKHGVRKTRTKNQNKKTLVSNSILTSKGERIGA